MNAMYDLHISDVPIPASDEQLIAFYSILREETGEILGIVQDRDMGLLEDPIDRVVALADLLADVIVYCKSEALKFGIPIDEVFDIVMESNFSKLGKDGQPIKDKRGKFLKGPNYWAPEPRIRELIVKKITKYVHKRESSL